MAFSTYVDGLSVTGTPSKSCCNITREPQYGEFTWASILSPASRIETGEDLGCCVKAGCTTRVNNEFLVSPIQVCYRDMKAGGCLLSLSRQS